MLVKGGSPIYCNGLSLLLILLVGVVGTGTTTGTGTGITRGAYVGAVVMEVFPVSTVTES